MNMFNSKRPEYRSWASMRFRCHNPDHPKFGSYGGRGIVVCERWRTSFEVFFADMGERTTPKHTIDRKDNDGNYEPSNCRWATQSEQAKNRRDTRYLTFDGRTMCLKDWAKESGVDSHTIVRRLKKGIPLNEILCSENRSYRMITFDGETKSLKEWAASCGVSYYMIRKRYTMGLEPAQILGFKVF